MHALLVAAAAVVGRLGDAVSALVPADVSFAALVVVAAAAVVAFGNLHRHCCHTQQAQVEGVVPAVMQAVECFDIVAAAVDAGVAAVGIVVAVGLQP